MFLDKSPKYLLNTVVHFFVCFRLKASISHFNEFQDNLAFCVLFAEGIGYGSLSIKGAVHLD